MSNSFNWNPWHGCTKKSEGCLNCYVYRGDKRYGSTIDSSICRKTLAFNMPIKKDKKGNYKIPPKSFIYTCFESDFLLEDADVWRDECFNFIKERSDCLFLFFTKRIERFKKLYDNEFLKDYPNLICGCTVENQRRADERLTIFREINFNHKIIVVEPMLERVNLSKYLDETIEEVCAGGESGPNARILDFEWIKELRDECIEKDITFSFHQTGNRFKVQGIIYSIERKYQHSQAKKSKMDYKSSRKIKREYKEINTNGQLSLDL